MTAGNTSGDPVNEALNRTPEDAGRRPGGDIGEQEAAAKQQRLSISQELHAANVALETSEKARLALEQELNRVKAALNSRSNTLMRSNSDLANLFENTSIATLFVDNERLIRRFTPRLSAIFKLLPGDEGRPIDDIGSCLDDDRLGRDVEQVLRSKVSVAREVATANGGTSFLMQIRPYRGANNVIDGAVVTFTDITERKQHERARSHLAAIVESSQDAIISFDLTGMITSWNGGAEHLYGHTAAQAIGQFGSALLAGVLPGDWPHTLTMLKDGQPIAHFDSTRIAKDGRSIDASVTISPVKEDDGRLVGASVVARDISERRAAEEKNALLLGELDHRVKNILAIVAAVVSQTLKTSATPEAFAADVQGRIQAIAKAHSLLTAAGQGEISMRALIETELAPYDDGKGKVTITGRPVGLTPKTGLALAMAIHELASNAAKYGSLSTVPGRLTVGWTFAGIGDSQTMTLAWGETGGPPVQPPSRRGFGTTLIERALAHELDAQVSREFLAAGLCCSIVMPFTKEVGQMRPSEGHGEDSHGNGT